jgi:hypothetical protein
MPLDTTFPTSVVLPVLAALCLCACSDSTGPRGKEIRITSMDWTYQNTPPDYNSTFSLSMDFSLRYTGANLVLADVVSATVSSASDPGWWWNLLPNGTSLNDSAKTIGYGWYNLYSSSLSSNGSVMPCGKFNFAVVLSDMDAAQDTLNAPGPGAAQGGGCKFVYNEDYHNQVTSEFCPVLRRPAVQTATRIGDTIAVAFSIADTMAYGGWLWYYDANNKYIGMSERFRNSTTKALSSILNGGSELTTDGATNTVKATASTSTMLPGEQYGSIRSVRVVVTDGRQYPTTARHDCRGVSSLAALP